MRKLFVFVILIGILGGIYFLLWPGPSTKMYQDNYHLFEYDRDAPLEIRIITSEKILNSQKVDLTYASPSGGRVPATIFRPKGKGPYAAILLMHGMPGNRQNMFGLAHQYVKTGAVVMVIDAPHARTSPGKRPPLYFNE